MERAQSSLFRGERRSQLDCTLFACWELGHEEPWFILTDLEPDQSEVLWYAMLAWIEHSFKLLKSQVRTVRTAG